MEPPERAASHGLHRASTTADDPELREYMRAQALSALAEHYTPKKPAASSSQSARAMPSLGPAPKPGSKPLFAPDDFTQQEDPLANLQPLEWEEDPDLAMAIEMSLGPTLNGAPAAEPSFGSSVAGPSGTRHSSSEPEEEDDDMDMEPVPLDVLPPVPSQPVENLTLPSLSPSRSLTPYPVIPSFATSSTAAPRSSFPKPSLISSTSEPTALSSTASTASQGLQRTVSTSSFASGSQPIVSPALQRSLSMSRTPSTPQKDLFTNSTATPTESPAPIFRSRPTPSKPVPVGTVANSGASRLHLSETIRGDASAVASASEPTVVDKGKTPEWQRTASRELSMPPREIPADQSPEPSPTRITPTKSKGKEAESRTASRGPSHDVEAVSTLNSPQPSPVRSTPSKSTPAATPSASQRALSRQPSSSSLSRKPVEIEDEDEPPEAHLSDEDEIQWSRSPSPTGKRSRDIQPPDDWDAAQEMDVEGEEADFANLMSEVKGKDISSMQKEIDEEIVNLNKQRKAAMVASEDVTQQMVTQIQVCLMVYPKVDKC